MRRVFFALTFLLLFSRPSFAGEILEEAARLSAEFEPEQVELAEPAMPGGIYKLPAVTVKNTGTTEQEFQISTTFLGSHNGISRDVDWIEASPWRVTLGPGEEAKTDLQLKVPVTAPTGGYFFRLELRRVAEDGEAQPNPLAFTDVRFDVKEAGLLTAVGERFASYVKFNPRIKLILAGALIVVAIGMVKGS